MRNNGQVGATKVRIRAAAGALFDRGGLEAVTMRAIAREVGIAAPSLYRHYESREAILEEIWRLGLEELSISMAEPIAATGVLERVLTLLDRYVAWAYRQPAIYDLKDRLDPGEKDLLKRAAGGGIAEAANAPLAILAGEVEAAIARGEIPSHADPWTTVLAIWSLGHGVVSLQRSGQVELEASELARVARNCMRPLLVGLSGG
jgi:AcrR family transcriptional regulator